VTPMVGTAKNVVEIFTGDWIPDKTTSNVSTKTVARPNAKNS
jgi:hypothetical protein